MGYLQLNFEWSLGPLSCTRQVGSEGNGGRVGSVTEACARRQVAGRQVDAGRR